MPACVLSTVISAILAIDFALPNTQHVHIHSRIFLQYSKCDSFKDMYSQLTIILSYVHRLVGNLLFHFSIRFIRASQSRWPRLV